MRHLVLAKKGKRILARLIDMAIVLTFGFVLFFAHVYPAHFNADLYEQNRQKVIEGYQTSELFLLSKKDNYAGKSTFDYNSYEEIFNKTLEFDGETYPNQNLSKDLYDYYTIHKERYTESPNLNLDGYKISVLQVGSAESNIASFDATTYEFTLIDNTKKSTTLSFFLARYEEASRIVDGSPVVSKPKADNSNLIFSTVVLIIPCLAVFSFIFDLIIPLFMDHGQTIGKKMFKLMVVNKSGYKYKKILLLPRFIVYFSLELVLGICTIGGFLLISYTMFLFTKNRRCLHDFICASCVIDQKDSIYFDSPSEERYFLEHGGSL